jgi:hypothetical protein
MDYERIDIPKTDMAAARDLIFSPGWYNFENFSDYSKELPSGIAHNVRVALEQVGRQYGIGIEEIDEGQSLLLTTGEANYEKNIAPSIRMR